LTHFNQLSIQVQSPLFGEVQDILPQLNDHRLKAYFMIELLNQWGSYPNLDFEALACQALEYLKQLDEPDLECVLYV
jgi:hypothetical protein